MSEAAKGIHTGIFTHERSLDVGWLEGKLGVKFSVVLTKEQLLPDDVRTTTDQVQADEGHHTLVPGPQTSFSH